MKNKKRIVCFGDSNTWGFNADGCVRFDDHLQWTHRLQNLLGNEFLVRDEGVCGRTSVFDDPLTEGLNGMRSIAATMSANKPVELLIITLGTNDCKERFSATAENIADGIIALANKAKNLDYWLDKPKILIVNPVIIGKGYEQSRIYDSMGKNCASKSELLGKFLEEKTKEKNYFYWDSNTSNLSTSPLDFVHLDEKGQENFANGIYIKIKECL